MGIASLLEPTFSAGVAGTVLGPVHSFILTYLLRYITKPMSPPVESKFQQGRQATCHTRNPCQPLHVAEGDEGCGGRSRSQIAAKTRRPRLAGRVSLLLLISFYRLGS